MPWMATADTIAANVSSYATLCSEASTLIAAESWAAALTKLRSAQALLASIPEETQVDSERIRMTPQSLDKAVQSCEAALRRETASSGSLQVQKPTFVTVTEAVTS